MEFQKILPIAVVCVCGLITKRMEIVVGVSVSTNSISKMIQYVGNTNLTRRSYSFNIKIQVLC